jgi:glycosyltransferase involved in cell wall biosynthesis
MSPVFANAKNTANRMARFNGVAAQPLYHPPPLADRLAPGKYGDYLLVVGRLETVKRPDLAVRALRHVPRRCGWSWLATAHSAPLSKGPRPNPA